MQVIGSNSLIIGWALNLDAISPILQGISKYISIWGSVVETCVPSFRVSGFFVWMQQSSKDMSEKCIKSE